MASLSKREKANSGLAKKEERWALGLGVGVSRSKKKGEVTNTLTELKDLGGKEKGKESNQGKSIKRNGNKKKNESKDVEGSLGDEGSPSNKVLKGGQMESKGKYCGLHERVQRGGSLTRQNVLLHLCDWGGYGRKKGKRRKVEALESMKNKKQNSRVKPGLRKQT